MEEDEDNSREERRSPSQATVENTVAIGQLAVISERTTKDVDRLVMHIEKILPVHEQISMMKKILYATILTSTAFAGWITIAVFDVKENLRSHTDVQKEHDKTRKEADVYTTQRINHNKNQITYLKGRIKK